MRSYVFPGNIDPEIMEIGSKPGFYRVSHMGLQSDDELEESASRIKEFENEQR